MVQYLHFRILEFPLIYIYIHIHTVNYVAFATSRKAIEKTQIENVLLSKSSTQKKIPNTPFFPCFFPSQGEKKKTMFSQPCGYGSRLDTVPIHGSSQSLVISLREKKTSHPIVLGIFHWQMQPHWKVKGVYSFIIQKPSPHDHPNYHHYHPNYNRYHHYHQYHHYPNYHPN